MVEPKAGRFDVTDIEIIPESRFKNQIGGLTIMDQGCRSLRGRSLPVFRGFRPIYPPNRDLQGRFQGFAPFVFQSFLRLCIYLWTIIVIV